jgi:hypothetical protein
VGTRERIIPGVCPIGNTGTSQIFVPANLGHSQFKTGHCNEVDPGLLSICGVGVLFL